MQSSPLEAKLLNMNKPFTFYFTSDNQRTLLTPGEKVKRSSNMGFHEKLSMSSVITLALERLGFCFESAAKPLVLIRLAER